MVNQTTNHHSLSLSLSLFLLFLIIGTGSIGAITSSNAGRQANNKKKHDQTRFSFFLKGKTSEKKNQQNQITKKKKKIKNPTTILD